MLSQGQPARAASVGSPRKRLSDQCEVVKRVEIQNMDPIRPSGASIIGTGTGTDGFSYHIKGCSDTPTRAFNEALVTRLAAVCKVPVPHSELVWFEGRLYFGSRTIGNLAEHQTIVRVLREDYRAPGARQGLSRALAFDLALANTDRHYKNFLWQTLVPGTVRLWVIDFDTAALGSGIWIPRESFSPKSRTVDQILKINDTLGFDLESARDTLTRLICLDDGYLRKIADDFPPAWLRTDEFQRFNKWWVELRPASLHAAERELMDYV